MPGSRDLPEPRRPDPLPWEKQKGESRQAFANFAHYRDLGPHRSLAKAAHDLGKAVGTLTEQSRKYAWGERSDAYDAMVDRRLRDEQETERMRLARVHSGAAASMLGKAMQRINGDVRRLQDGSAVTVEAIDANDLDAADVARWLDVSIKWGRVIAGLPTDVVKGTTMVAGSDLERIVRDVVAIAERHLDEARQQRFFGDLDRYFQTGSLPW